MNKCNAVHKCIHYYESGKQDYNVEMAYIYELITLDLFEKKKCML